MSLDPEARDDVDAVEMLTHGQGLAFQLRDLLLDDQIAVSRERLMLADDLLDKIQGSFSHTISALDRRHSAEEMNKPNEYSGESSRRSSSLPKPVKSRRKRREVSEGESRIEITSTLVQDGHAWRKYGQKSIHNSKFSRNYFKCTHKDQCGCPAKKHIQQLGDNPVSYQTVYTYTHTCTNMMANPSLHGPAQMVLHSGAGQPDMNMSSSSIILNFQSNQQHDSDMNQIYTSLNDQAGDQHHTSVQLASGNNNVGSSSDAGRENIGMEDDHFMNFFTDYSPYTSYSHNTDDLPWFP